MPKLKTTKEFIKDAKEVHGNRYGYDKVNYINNHIPVKIWCFKHKKYFLQTPKTHLQGCGCPSCGSENSISLSKKLEKQLIKKSKAKFGDKIDYSKVKYVNSKTKVIFICKDHGKEFEQTPSSHLISLDGCPICCNERRREERIYSKQDFLDTLSKEKKERFDYTNMVYNGYKEDITIRCLLHGELTTKAESHSQAESGGCTKCQYEILGLYKAPAWSYTQWERYSKKSKDFTGFKIYVVKMKEDDGLEFFKIGKTYLSVKRRTTYFPYNVEIVYIIKLEQARETCELEVELQNKCKQNSYIPKKEFSGKYECFSSIDPILPFLE